MNKRKVIEVNEVTKKRFDELRDKKGMTVNGLIKWLVELGEKK